MFKYSIVTKVSSKYHIEMILKSAFIAFKRIFLLKVSKISLFLKIEKKRNYTEGILHVYSI